jgi:hypothetical protein
MLVENFREMDERAIREFVSRDWQEASQAKSEYLACLYREDPRALWSAAQALLTHVRRMRPDFPTAAEREADLRDHWLLRSRLDRAAHAFSGR